MYEKNGEASSYPEKFSKREKQNRIKMKDDDEWRRGLTSG
jgi:hypothetical protein